VIEIYKVFMYDVGSSGEDFLNQKYAEGWVYVEGMYSPHEVDGKKDVLFKRLEVDEEKETLRAKMTGWFDRYNMAQQSAKKLDERISALEDELLHARNAKRRWKEMAKKLKERLTP